MYVCDSGTGKNSPFSVEPKVSLKKQVVRVPLWSLQRGAVRRSSFLWLVLRRVSPSELLAIFWGVREGKREEEKKERKLDQMGRAEREFEKEGEKDSERDSENEEQRCHHVV